MSGFLSTQIYGEKFKSENLLGRNRQEVYHQNVLEGYLIKGALMVRLIILIFIFVKMMTIKSNL